MISVVVPMAHTVDLFWGIGCIIRLRLLYRRETIAGIFQTRMMIPPSRMRYHTIRTRMRVLLKIRGRGRFNFMSSLSVSSLSSCSSGRLFQSSNLRDAVLKGFVYIKFKIFIFNLLTFLWQSSEQHKDKAAEGITPI